MSRFTKPQGGLFFGHASRARAKTKDAGEFAKKTFEQGVTFVPGVPFFAGEPDVNLPACFATADVTKIEEVWGDWARLCRSPSEVTTSAKNR